MHRNESHIHIKWPNFEDLDIAAIKRLIENLLWILKKTTREALYHRYWASVEKLLMISNRRSTSKSNHTNIITKESENHWLGVEKSYFLLAVASHGTRRHQPSTMSSIENNQKTRRHALIGGRHSEMARACAQFVAIRAYWKYPSSALPSVFRSKA